MDPQTFAALTAPAGQDLLARVSDAAPGESDLALGTRLRRDHPAELVAAAMTQHHLRRRAVAKFGSDAARMYFTPDALEQSTRATVAAHRAARLAGLGGTALVDLGCGIGGDLIASARAGLRVHGVEQDPVRAAIARANLAALGLEGTVEVGDATTIAPAPDEVAFVDPARRDGSGRTFRLDALVPSWDFVTGLLHGRAVAKVMPGIAHDAVPPGVQAEWVSDGGDLVEASLWGAGFDLPTHRRATVLPAAATLTGRDAEAATGPLLSHLVEPDDAVIRAGLVAELAGDLGGHLLDPHIAWITTDSPAAEPFGRAFRVEAELPFREKQLRAALRERDIGTLTVKKRGIDIVPERLIARLKLSGSRTATVVLTRVAGEGRAFLVARER
ncbi:class I SAM-dependent methyltransferase [Aeromicrobium flavum]|uniref:class I SAM-dependent methyltransferase n=1 Tax=Aeromicrobium flavum TaxID=416568 RepID=UPI001FE9DC68|nr:class I SAM-dependent methyltransferase [Aeromicrobium flavum]